MESPNLLDDPRAEHLSAAARRLLRRPRPRFRGVLHRWAASACIPVGIWATIAADGAEASIAMAVFAIGALVMLGASAITHLRESIERVEMLVRLDHSAIFVMFTTSATPVASWRWRQPQRHPPGLRLDGGDRRSGARYLPFHPPRGLVNTIFLTLAPAFLPWLIDGLSGPQLWLLLGGALPYVIGALIVGSQWPDPWTDVFGYHEIWHVMVVLSAGLHYWLAMELTGVV